MQKIIMKNKCFSIFLILFALLGGNAAFAESDAAKATPQTAANLNLSGLYLGFYPCDDCQGIRTTLALNKSETYVYISLYVGKSDREFVEKGKFTVSDNMLTLTPRKGSATTQKYLIEGDNLIKLDEDGNRITKDGADGYILHRKDVMKIGGSGQHAGH